MLSILRCWYTITCEHRVPYRTDRIINSPMSALFLETLHEFFIGNNLLHENEALEIPTFFDFFPQKSCFCVVCIESSFVFVVSPMSILWFKKM